MRDVGGTEKLLPSMHFLWNDMDVLHPSILNVGFLKILSDPEVQELLGLENVVAVWSGFGPWCGWSFNFS